MAKIHTPIPALKLNDGNAIPMLGYGLGTAWYKRGDHSKVDQSCVDTIKMALDMGWTHIDGAESYGTELEQGKAIKESGIKREKLYITTKLSPSSHDDIQGAFRRSLKLLQLDYVDLYLIHSPFPAGDKPELLSQWWKEMEAIKEAGLAKSIGVSNYQVKHLDQTLSTAKIVPAVNQVELHGYLQRPELIAYCQKKGIAVTAYAPLSPVTKAPGPLDQTLARLAKKYAVSPGEICLRWCIDQDIVPITTSAKEQRLSDMLRAMTFKLTPKEVKDINEAGQEKNARYFQHSFAPDDYS